MEMEMTVQFRVLVEAVHMGNLALMVYRVDQVD
jgi:hypothetical protein